jgi:hypothetical protein
VFSANEKYRERSLPGAGHWKIDTLGKQERARSNSSPSSPGSVRMIVSWSTMGGFWQYEFMNLMAYWV